MSEARYYVGDVFDRMADIPDGSVDLIVTSPPFLALRSYLPVDHPDKAKEIGSEATPAAFLSTLLALTREWRRLLAPHGSLCVELGDTYSGSGGAGGDYKPEGEWTKYKRGDLSGVSSERRQGPGWPLAKSLCLLPSLYAGSLAYGRNLLDPADQLDQWRVRNLIVWHRPNPPVGALGDKVRPSTSYVTVACVSDRRWFDLDSERTAAIDTDPRNTNGPKALVDRGDHLRVYETRTTNPAGAPLLDCWTIPTQPYAVAGGTIILPEAGTFHRFHVPVDASGDGIRRTTSPDCPVHASPGLPGSTSRDGERAAGASTRTGHNGSRPARGRAAGSPPTSSTLDLTGSDEAPDALAATPRSTPASRTGHAPATTPVDTPSARTTPRTGDTPAGPESSAPHPDTLASSSAAAFLPADARGTSNRTADTSDPSSACSCSYYVEVSIPAQSSWNYATWPDEADEDVWTIPTQAYAGSHYATFPPALPRKLINLMCPRSVCVGCGEPRRRIVETNGSPYPFTYHQGQNGGMGTGGVGGHTATREATTLGWSDCGHNTWRRGVVLDPFAGSGTTLQAASELGRDSIGIDLDPRNLELARQRCGMFLVEEAETV